MECPQCGTNKVVSINLQVAERAVTMRSCGRCDRRWWDTDGERVDLTNVLELATVRR